MPIKGPDVDPAARIQGALPIEFLEDCQIAEARASPSPVREFVQPFQKRLRFLEEPCRSEGRLTEESFLDEVDEGRRRLPPLVSVAVLADVIPGLDDGAHRQQQSVGPDLSLHLGKDLPMVPAAVWDLKDLTEDGSVDEADAHEA